METSWVGKGTRLSVPAAADGQGRAQCEGGKRRRLGDGLERDPGAGIVGEMGRVGAGAELDGAQRWAVVVDQIHVRRRREIDGDSGEGEVARNLERDAQVE